jgi:hypothetical protein
MLSTSIKVDLKRALAGGALAAAVTLTGMWLSGLASGSAVNTLLRDFLPSAQDFSGTITLASATILALMLTLLGMSSSSDSTLKPAHYVRIRQIAFGDALVFVFSVTLGLLLNVPLTESSKLGAGVEAVVYYGALGLTALLGGALVAIVLMIYNAVADMIDVLALGKEEHPLYDTEKSGAPPDDEAPQRQRDAD